MKITAGQLRRIIKEEVAKVISEGAAPTVEETIANYKRNPRSWEMGSADFYDMAAGGDAYGVRADYYPSWEDADFQAVIDALSSLRR
jgi:hypothetical protein